MKSLSWCKSLSWGALVLGGMLNPVWSQPSTPFLGGPLQPGAISAGRDHSLAIHTTSRIDGWGLNSFGQRVAPFPNTNFTRVSAGELHSLGLQEGGVIVAWGRSAEGQLVVPVPNTNYTAVSAGGFHNLALHTDGFISAWGRNTAGQANVPAPNTNFIAVAGGRNHSLGLKASGDVVAWGFNNKGQATPPSPNTNFIAIAGGDLHSLGLKSDGSVVAWGDNDSGQLDVPVPNTGFVAIAAGYLHSVGLKEDGSLVAWGDDSFQQLELPSPNADFVAIAANGYHSLALRTDGSIVAWGRNNSGQTNVSSAAEFGIRSPGLVPASGSVTGGYEVVISGYFLGDVTNVTLAGISVDTILVQTSTQLVVTAGSAPGPTQGVVHAFSVSAGDILLPELFRYIGEQTIDFPPIGNQRSTNIVDLVATASSGLGVIFSVLQGPASITNDTLLSFTGTGVVAVVAQQPGDDDWAAAPSVTNSFLVEDPPVLLEIFAGPNGATDITTGPQPAGSTVDVTALPDLYYQFAGWTGDIEPGEELDNPVSILMDGPKSITAAFEPQTTISGVPLPWLAGFGFTNDFENVVVNDFDDDGVTTGDEYVADTDPTDDLSFLAISSVVTGSGEDGYQTVVSFPVSTQRVYDVEARVPVDTGTWESVSGLTNLMPDTTVLILTNAPVTESVQWYRVTVRKP